VLGHRRPVQLAGQGGHRLEQGMGDALPLRCPGDLLHLEPTGPAPDPVGAIREPEFLAPRGRDLRSREAALPAGQLAARQGVDLGDELPVGSSLTWVTKWAFIPRDFLINVSMRIGPRPPFSCLATRRKIAEVPGAFLLWRA
jgi:hypothetical protein